MRPPESSDIGLILVIISIVIASGIATWLFYSLRQQKKKQNKDDKYLKIAKERYAKGEISSEQYEQIKKEFS
jgi:uncharacterized membrane protein